jgi:peptidoglycan lytic transglycosylase G
MLKSVLHKVNIKNKKIIGLIVILGFLIFSANILYRIYGNNTLKSGFVLIPHNTTIASLTDSLKTYLNNDASFKWVASLKKYDKKIKSGRYYIKKGWNNNTLINHLRSGKQEPINLVFNNQNNLNDLSERLAKQVEPDAVSILNAMRDSVFLKQQHLTLDNALGIYIPNSYQVYWNISAIGLRDKLFKEYQLFWQRNGRLKKAENIHLSPQQVISLAAIVQKETAKVDERPVVAGLYLNRLKRGWPLQADPTIIFVLKQHFKKDTLIKRVLNKDLLIKSPYNTYLNKGLPPGPIAMPDVSSIDAVLNAKKHRFMFMCASTKKIGYHEFATNKYQHAKNAALYQRWISKQGIRR